MGELYTLAERQFWGPPEYTRTIVDEIGHPVGIAWEDGTITYTIPSKVGQTFAQEGYTYEIVWDGAYIAPNTGYTKGRLLPVEGPAYLDSLVVFCTMLKVRGETAEQKRERKKRDKAVAE